jgi:serine/threonine-protein kinase
MGVVCRVFDRVVGEARALKRIKPEEAADPLSIQAFEREYHVLASLDHPRIIRVFDFGVDDAGAYYTMELLEGQDMRQAAPLPFKKACLYLRDIATSLALLHARRLIHRDLSPSNVRLTKDGHCKLLDFGALANFGLSKVVVGTPPMIPPEALQHSLLDQRADLDSLGALAYWMLTGRHAYPARNVAELFAKWMTTPPPPSTLSPEIPRELDGLVQSLLHTDPLARPGSAAEVIARLTVIADLPLEDSTQAERLARSFLLSPRFTGRAAELRDLGALTDAATHGKGGAVCIQALAGMGRTRLLEEVGFRAQLAGATVIRVDASMYRQQSGTTRALALRLLDAVPDLAQEHCVRHRLALSALGSEVESRLGSRPSLTRVSAPPAAASAQLGETTGSLEGWFAEISQRRPLLIQVDNVEYADDASLGLLASLAKMSAEHSLLLITTERLSRATQVAIGLATLRNHSSLIELAGLSANEMHELVRSLFGDAPNVQRFAEWLHERSAGGPLHAVEICRQLASKQVIRYAAGLWTLPVERPDAELPAALGDALSIRIASLSEPALALAQCISLARQQPTLDLCPLLTDRTDERPVLQLLDELAQNDVLYPDRDGYRFSSTALREALLVGMDDVRLEQNHRRLGEALSNLAGDDNPALRIEAGWHLIQGGDELRGADMIAAVTHDAVTVRTLIANLHRAGRPLEAALSVYSRHRRSIYERMPLLAALAQAGYYEDRCWGEWYGDEALDVLDDISGLRTARRLKRFVGRWLALILGILFAFVRFRITPLSERKYSFDKILVQLFGAVTTLTGAASLSLDAERAARTAELLEPFAILPKRLTPAGIWQFCNSVQEIGRENEAKAYDEFDTLIKRFEDPKYYPTLPADGRRLYIAGAHFARASFAIFRARGQTALESADALDATGLKLYAMIASQLRFLYYTMRGEFAKAAPHREQVELHAAHVGSVWQVETWEAPALILITTSLSDIVGGTRIAHRLELMSRSVPSLKRHTRLAKQGLMLARRDFSYTESVSAEYASHPPRSYIGWAATMGFLARGYNELGKHAEAKATCERTLVHVTDADREYVALFLVPDIELAIAEAGLGNAADGLARIDRLLERFADCDHPLVQGLLNEARARISWSAGNVEEYEQSRAEVERLFRPTDTPVLIAKCEALAQLGATDSVELRAALADSDVTIRHELEISEAGATDVAHSTIRQAAR